jgi:N-acetylglucosaminyldiphosphoundecaprenol N-acetyl-beta-D-mannosaminyltransferase
MTRLDPAVHRCFFIANKEATGDAIRTWLLTQGFARDSIEVCVPPLRFEFDQEYSDKLAYRVREHKTTHLFIGLGAPKSEIWCYQNRLSIGDCYVMSVGAGLEFFVGLKKRAPAILQKIGLEWLWRLGHEPQRLSYRYLIQSWGVVIAIADDLLSDQRT